MGASGTIGFDGCFRLQCYRNGELIWDKLAPNVTTTQGREHILTTEFKGGSAVTTWYIGLIRDDNYSEIIVGDTMASHAGWEEADEYDEATRQEWVEGTVGSGALATTGGSEATFTINGTETMKGAFLTSSNTKSGSTGTLMAAGLFTGGDQAVVDDDVIKVTYTITTSDV